MKIRIEFEDVGAKSVAMTTEILEKSEAPDAQPTPAAIISMAVRALYENGILAEAGRLGLEALSENKSVADHVKNNLKDTQ